MKRFSPPFATAIARPATTLCRCWRVTQADGAAVGFTDHDRPLSFDGLDFLPGDGLDTTAASLPAGLAAGGLEVSGAFSDARLSAADLSAGLYDGARVDCFVVDWETPDARALVQAGTIGEVREEGGRFVAELRGLAAGLDAERGRVFSPFCDAAFGDHRCRADLNAFTDEGMIVATDGRRGFTFARPARPEGFFDGGRVAFSSGDAAGLTLEIASEVGGSVSLWQEAPRDLRAGDAFRITAGCDKRFATCRDRFANTLNFRGFPLMPGNDFVLSVAKPGGTRVRPKEGK